VRPLSVKLGMGDEAIDEEARVICLEFDKFFLVNAYFPHANRELKRLDFKLRFNDLFLKFAKSLERKKPVVIAADFNVAHKEVDLRNPKQNMKNAGFTEVEREWFDNLLKEGFVDSFREFTKEGGNYTWWTYRNNARERNIGWRIDYLVVSDKLKDKLKNSEILKDVLGSDHCPILLNIKVS
ncbi:MAG: exodeoxyribonuclease III, partial [Nanoarchaeota archaeon]|nr:exodeoxyribonuclease III [Nanoarchaeota archaeon]